MIKRVPVMVWALSVLLILISEAHSIVYAIDETTRYLDASGWFAIQMPKDSINSLWWLKGLEGYPSDACKTSAFAIVAKPYSKKVYYMVLLLFVRDLFGMVMYMYDYSQSVGWFWGVAVAIIVLTALVVWPFKEKDQAVVINME